MQTFDGPNKLIINDSGTTSFDVREVYSRWKDWVALSDNAKFLQAFSVVGGNPTIGSNIITPYFFLENDWKVRPQEANHTLQVDGIMLTIDSSDAFVDTLGTFRVGVQSIVPILTETVIVSGGSGSCDLTEVLTAIEEIPAAVLDEIV